METFETECTALSPVHRLSVHDHVQCTAEELPTYEILGIDPTKGIIDPNDPINVESNPLLDPDPFLDPDPDINPNLESKQEFSSQSDNTSASECKINSYEHYEILADLGKMIDSEPEITSDIYDNTEFEIKPNSMHNSLKTNQSDESKPTKGDPTIEIKPNPRDDIFRPYPRYDISKPDPRDDISEPNPMDDIPKPDSRDDISKPDLRDDISKPNPRDDIPKPNPRDDISKPDSRDDISKLDPRDDIPEPDPRVDIISKPDPRVDIISKPDPRDDISKPDPRDDISKPDPSEIKSEPAPSTRLQFTPIDLGSGGPGLVSVPEHALLTRVNKIIKTY